MKIGKLQAVGHSLILLFVGSAAEAASPPPVIPTVDTSGVMDLGTSLEEQIVSEGLPPTPESGSENPEDLLSSGPAVHTPTRKSAKAAKQPDGLPEALPLVPGTADSDPHPPISEDLPPPAEEISEAQIEEPQAEELPPAEVATVEEESSDAQSTEKWDRKTPMVDRENPSLGIEFHGSIQALGTPILSDQLDTNGVPTGVVEESNVRNFGFGFEYEPAFLQSIGVVSIGPSFNLYMLEPEGDLTENSFSIYSLGLSIKYQLRFMDRQFLVPFVGFETQMIRYSFQDATVGQGWTTASGLTFGALLLLNTFEPSAAHSLWSETGIRRSYLFAEVKNLTAGETLLSTDGTAIFFGLRLER